MNIFAAFEGNDNIISAFYHPAVHDEESIPGQKALVSDEDHKLALSHMGIGGKVKVIKGKKISEIELIPIPLDQLKEEKKLKLYFKCREQIQEGFKCSVDRKDYIYPSKEGNGFFDQTNIKSISPISLWRKNEKDEWEYVLHKSKELQIVQLGLADHIESCREHLNKLIKKIDGCQDSELQSIFWDYK